MAIPKIRNFIDPLTLNTIYEISEYLYVDDIPSNAYGSTLRSLSVDTELFFTVIKLEFFNGFGSFFIREVIDNDPTDIRSHITYKPYYEDVVKEEWFKAILNSRGLALLGDKLIPSVFENFEGSFEELSKTEMYEFYTVCENGKR